MLEFEDAGSDAGPMILPEFTDSKQAKASFFSGPFMQAGPGVAQIYGRLSHLRISSHRHACQF